MAPIDFLAQLTPQLREALLAEGRRRSFRKGDYVFRVGDDGDSVFILLAGRAKTYKVSSAGRETILWFCYPGELFGIAAHPHDKGRMVSVQVSEVSEAAEIPHARFGAFIDAHPGVAKLCVQSVAYRLGMLANRLVGLTADDAGSRVAKLLIDLSRRSTGHETTQTAARVGITHQEVADITGVQRQTVSRIIGQLTTCGALRPRYGQIIIADRKRLAEYARDH